MRTIRDAFQINATPYSELSDNHKKIIDTAANNLKDVKDTILSFEKEFVNFIKDHPRHYLVIDSSFPQDLTNKIVSAFLFASNSSSDTVL